MNDREAVRFYANPSLADVKRLLGDCSLPTDDICQERLVHFFVLERDGALSAVVGVEPLGLVALLRSLAVAPSCRGKGYAKQLVSIAEARATEYGCADVYLLTEIAAEFFGKIGYGPARRDAAPAAIRESSQFTSLCPASAALMMKRPG